ncbi:cytochrome c oxidase subunit III [Roseimicrobium gellanilyticum]|uniref:Cytochrome c oxidase subunit III n=1 Tax=Roseimicrobium gellanilyticum TaxID=748857 RepID=A0A366HT88_9BACT|nr:cytochrome c oxidase subunit 3 [Roseimicrobium gellanilyticum]RBP47501.1 cytochrome c oxidase subunit III [Roseimicrobium gellanilyticum]
MEIPYTVKARPDTGLWNAKIGVWLFLASEVMLFGGLFSAYIFLRLAPEGPWPVQVLTVSWGFWNTLILILSSVTVLQAWVALKLRKYNLFRIWMALTIFCAFAFLGIKSIEYNDKFHHYGLRLHDGSVMEGHLPHEADGSHGKYKITFSDVTTVTLASRPMDMGLFGISFFHNGSDGEFLKYITEGEPKFKTEDGAEITLDEAKVKELMDHARSKEHKDEKGVWKPIASVKLTAVKPLKFTIPAGKMFDNSWTEKNAYLRDGTVLEGKLTDDAVKLEVDKLDFRWLFPHHEKDEEKAFAAALNADLWKHIPNGAELKEKFKTHRAHHLDHFHKKHDADLGGKAVPNPMNNDDFVRNTYSVLHAELEKFSAGGATHEPAKHSSNQDANGTASRVAALEQGAAHDASGGGHHDHPTVTVPHKEVAHFSNFTPKWHNYYAIYFCITGLHGLHVLAGALVLSYFLLFGKKLYDKDPEHMANRVEVGGLFWHFVDLVWIFLFPLLYLL